MTIIEVEDEVPIERMDAAALEDVSVEEVAPLVVVVVVGRRWNSSVFCFFDESDDWSTFFFNMVSEYRATQF